MTMNKGNERKTGFQIQTTLDDYKARHRTVCPKNSKGKRTINALPLLVLKACNVSL